MGRLLAAVWQPGARARSHPHPAGSGARRGLPRRQRGSPHPWSEPQQVGAEPCLRLRRLERTCVTRSGFLRFPLWLPAVPARARLADRS